MEKGMMDPIFTMMDHIPCWDCTFHEVFLEEMRQFGWIYKKTRTGCRIYTSMDNQKWRIVRVCVSDVNNVYEPYFLIYYGSVLMMRIYLYFQVHNIHYRRVWDETARTDLNASCLFNTKQKILPHDITKVIDSFLFGDMHYLPYVE